MTTGRLLRMLDGMSLTLAGRCPPPTRHGHAVARFVTPLLLAAALLCLALPAPASRLGLDFSLHKIESGRPGPTVLVVGGIQGDEPGGFSAASLLVSHYRVASGAVWVVPNLNPLSMIRISRGVNGDLNRKFAALDPKDPDYPAIQRIKAIIADKRVDMVLNLHDGWGFYRPHYVDWWQCPDRWGQSIIVDQAEISTARFNRLEDLAQRVVDDVNVHLYEPGHVYHVKNTQTRRLDNETAKEMAKTLTFFAIGQGKPAFGIEASKNFPPHLRTYYHLRAVEAFFRQTGIEYDRSFDLAAAEIQKTMNQNLALSLFGDRIFLDLRDARDRLGFMPLKKNAALEFSAPSPLITLVDADRRLKVYYGNRNVTEIDPQYFDYDTSVKTVAMDIDGARREAPVGSAVKVGKRFSVLAPPEYRVNVIGFSKPGLDNEAHLSIGREDFMERFSVDKAGNIFRVEIYRGDKFAGMILVDFGQGLEHLARAGAAGDIPEIPAAAVEKPAKDIFRLPR